MIREVSQTTVMPLSVMDSESSADACHRVANDNGGLALPNRAVHPSNSSDDLLHLSRAELHELVTLTDRWLQPVYDSKFYTYQPNPVPKIFHLSEAKVRLVLGGNRSSKTYSMIMELAMIFLGLVPKSLQSLGKQPVCGRDARIRLCCIDYPNAFVKTIWPLIQLLIPKDEIADILTDMGRVKVITNKCGGFIEFMMYEQHTSKFQGTSRHVIGYDEEPPESVRDENLMRLVDTDGSEIFSFTPISEIDRPVLWIYDKLYLKAGRYVEKLSPESPEITDKTNPQGDQNIHVFFANIYDNQAIAKKAADRILSSFPKEERLVREKGHFLFLSGLVYKEYSDNKHLIDASHEAIKDWHLSDDHTLYIAIDPHPRVAHGVLFMTVRRDGTLFIVDELFIDTRDAAQLVEAIKAKQRGKIANVIIIDPLAYTPDPSSGSCLAYDLADAGLFPVPIRASKDLSRGIIKTGGVFAAPAALYINRECHRLRYELCHYIWDSWRKDTNSIKDIKQTPRAKDNHLVECLYRLILLNPEWVSENEAEAA